MITIQSYGNAALKLHENGYTPIPIVPASKRPIISNWSSLKNEYDIIDKLSIEHPNAGVGILLSDLIVFDIDILDNNLSLLVKKIITNELDNTVERIGKFPKRALFYRRSGNEFRKQSSQIFNFEKGKAQLEILASGNQCIVFGTHPETKKPYQWIEDSLLDVHIKDLPSVNIKQVKNIITQAEILLRNQTELKEVIRPNIKTSINKPIKEHMLLSGKLENTNEPYAIAKIAGIKMCENYNIQYQTNYKCLMPCNSYGPNDNYDLNNSHFIAALIKKIFISKIKSKKYLEIWGSGKPKREVIFVDDIAMVCLFFMNKKTKETLINIGSGVDYSIETYAKKIMKYIDIKLKIKKNKKMPDGVKRKLLDISLAKSYGWKPQFNFNQGLDITVRDFKKNLR